ncbi:MAG: NAD-binding protein [Chromatiaceae bacterium]
MDHIFFLVMRRMRAPLLALIGSYTLAIAGLVLIPGQDADGNPVSMGFFHAFYVVAYTGTTIGFGELPYPFTDAQRLWMSLGIFVTVGVWIYAVGTLIALFQDPAFQRAVADSRYRRRVQRLRDPFYLVCGHGQTGGALVRALTDRHQHAVVIDFDPERINLLALENQREYVPALCGDARRPSNLKAAGLDHPSCQGVVALTNVNETNLKIAIVAKLLRPKIKVICRADSHDIEANMASFGTDHIYDAFDTFALNMAIAVEAPCLNLLMDWLSGIGGETLREPLYPPSEGRWVICGYGRFGKAMYRHLREQGLQLTVIEAEPHRTGIPKEGVVEGRGTEAVTLEEAGIQRAVGLVAGTDNDANNLSILMTARALNPRLFVVARENHTDNHELFERAGAHVVMHPSTIVAHRIRVRLTLPLLSEFLTYARFYDNAWACELSSRIVALIQDKPPHVWQVEVDEEQAPALLEGERRGSPITLDVLLRDPRERDRPLPVIALLLEHQDQREVLPEPSKRLHKGDQVLLCGREEARDILDWTLQDLHTLSYVVKGEEPPEGWLWRWAARRRRIRVAGGDHRGAQ